MFKSLFVMLKIEYDYLGDYMKTTHRQKYKLLGLNIAYYRKLNGYTQESFAEKLDVDRTTISKIELATCGISLDLLFDISELLNISINKLFDFRD